MTESLTARCGLSLGSPPAAIRSLIAPPRSPRVTGGHDGWLEGGGSAAPIGRNWSAEHLSAFNGPPFHDSAIRMAESFGFSPLSVRKPGSVRHFAWPSGRMPGPSDVRLPDGPIAELLSCPEAKT